MAENVVKKLIDADISVKNAKVAIFSFTFIENLLGTRNSNVIDIVYELNEYGINLNIADPVTDKAEAKKEYGLEYINIFDIKEVDVLIFAVSRIEFLNM